MIINFHKTHPDAVIPTKAHPWDAAFDLTAVSMRIDEQYGFIEYNTHIICEVPRGFAGLLFPRSSLSKYELVLCNHVGILDSNFRGNILLRFRPAGSVGSLYNCGINWYNVGDRIAQLLIIPILGVEFNEVDELEKTDRGASGFGSSGS